MKENNNENAIEVKNISKKFFIPHEKVNTLKGAFVNFVKNILHRNQGEIFNALEGVSFEVKKGEFFGIIGRNGSGKSTLLKILAGIYNPDGGKIKIHGRISPFLELGIGFNPELSGRDNIYLNATVLGLTEKEIDQKFDSIVAFSELERFIDQKLKNYSSGMSVRLAFSVAIHANRDILLMDEVLAVGDSNFQSKCLSEFNRYKDEGKTVILVTHDIGTIQKYCDRAMLLRNGKIEIIGNSEEVGNKYIYQNMSDEEKRIFDEENRLEKIKGNEIIKEQSKEEKIAEITNVEFLDKDGKEKNVFETGESIDIKIDFKINKPVDVINIGIGLHSVTGGQIFGYNTQMDKIIINTNQTNLVLHFNILPLLKGDYSLNVACWGNVEQNHYDFKPNYKILKIFSGGVKNNYRGFFDIEHKWY
ncbi:TPA: ABC transporter ATP-binding protein [Candidatus Nomurabacteria bacterium]|nr:MAG: ABC-type polysaccharide/polyol phosphate transport system, ATPase component [Parcubacteria bacterium RAAC4_OD1_1]HCY26062.1 ABC transporter ATP-binding protein [Candidatus Nomurabacteria bacterium]